jgi:hypothetical protein
MRVCSTSSFWSESNESAVHHRRQGPEIVRGYDSYGRVTQLQKYVNSATEDATQRVTFHYDSNPFDGAYSANAWGRLTAAEYKIPGADVYEMYSYTPAGLPTKKKLRIVKNNTRDLEALYAYDNEGRRTAMTYPSAHTSVFNPYTGKTYTYGYDAAGRPDRMTDVPPFHRHRHRLRLQRPLRPTQRVQLGDDADEWNAGRTNGRTSGCNPNGSGAEHSDADRHRVWFFHGTTGNGVWCRIENG